MKSRPKSNQSALSTAKQKPVKTKSADQGAPAKKRNAAQPSADPNPFCAGSKSAAVITLLRRPQGATIQELMEATEWQSHSVRGFLAGTVRKKLNLKLTSTKPQNGDRCYKVSR